jgi:hypothetical protein
MTFSFAFVCINALYRQFVIGYFIDLDAYLTETLKKKDLTQARTILIQRQWDAVFSCLAEDAKTGTVRAHACTVSGCVEVVFKYRYLPALHLYILVAGVSVHLPELGKCKAYPRIFAILGDLMEAYPFFLRVFMQTVNCIIVRADRDSDGGDDNSEDGTSNCVHTHVFLQSHSRSHHHVHAHYHSCCTLLRS